MNSESIDQLEIEIKRLERDKLISERQELQRQKDSLNIEVSTLLDLKKHYAEQAKAFQVESEEEIKSEHVNPALN